MVGTSVPTPTDSRARDDVLARLSVELDGLSPELRKAAAYVLDQPNEVGLSSVRELAIASGVKPNTVVRMARAVGFDGFDDFREPFRASLRSSTDFPDRARWLQQVGSEGKHGALYADLAESAFANVSGFFASNETEQFRAVAEAIVRSQTTYVIGVGANYALAHNFAYLVRMAIDHVVAVPNDGNVPTDDVVRAGSGDLVLAMTFAPYRSEVVEATRVAQENGATVVALTDSRGSPIASDAAHTFVLPTTTPQFFPSTLAAAACLEVMVAFIVASGGRKVVDTIDRFHRRRYDLGVYWTER